MKLLPRFLLACVLPTLAPTLATAQTPAPAATPAAAESQAPRPEEVLVRSIHVLGSDMTGGVGLEKEIGVPVTFADVVDATILFPHAAITWHTFPSASAAGTQVEEIRRANATLLVAPDYLVPFVYADAVDDEARVRGVETALKLLETISCPIVLGDVPDLRATRAAKKPLFVETQIPSPATLTRVNEAVRTWAAARKNVAIAPVAAFYAHVAAGETFRAGSTNVPAAWMTEMLQENRVHPRAFGSIAVWLQGFDALHQLRPDLDRTRFDGNLSSVFQRLYASKEAERRAQLEKLLAQRRLPPNRPPPARPLPPDPEQSRREVEAKRRGIDVRELEREERENAKGRKGQDGGRDEGGG